MIPTEIQQVLLLIASLRLHISYLSGGVFLDNAQDLIQRPEPTYKMLEKRFVLAVKDAHSVGLTAVHDAGFNPRSLNFFQRSVLVHSQCLPF